MRIIDRLRLGGGITAPPIYKENPLLKKQLEQTQKDLNLILNKWTFGDTPLKSASEFLDNFEPWINKQLGTKKELEKFYKKTGIKNLTELEQRWNQQEQTIIGLNNSYDKLDKKYEELKKTKTAKLSEEDKEKLDSYEDLISDLDELKRAKKTLEQQNLALNNQLKNKQLEVNNKDKALDQLKKEKSKQEVNHQKQLKEKNGLITTLNQEIKQHKEKVKELEKQNSRLIADLAGGTE